MKATCFLILSGRGVERLTKTVPALAAGEIAVRLTVSADNKHFRMPYVEAAIQLEERHLIHPEVDVEVTP